MGGASIFPDNCLYSANSNMSGQSYYYGYTLGAAYKINDHWSVYGGARLLYGTTKYYGYVNNIRIVTPQGQDLGAWMRQNAQNPYVQGVLSNLFNDPAEALEDHKVDGLLTASTALVDDMLKEGISLNCTQDGYGVAPIIGVDFKTGNFNFAAKYEFKTRMRMKNKSDLKEASVISATNKFVNGTSVPEDAPALLTLGAQWSVTDNVRLNAGYHHFFDKSAHWYQHSEKLLDSDTNEYLGGAEWDINDKLQVSGGVQLTRYGLTDEYMNDMSFVVNSWTFGLGAGYKVSDKVKINVAYFQTNYEHYDMNTPE
jgi:long-subunit fatty acid transport protein